MTDPAKGLRATARRARGSLLLAYHLLEQRGFPAWKESAFRSGQQRRLRRIVCHAYATVPYYAETMRRIGLAPEDVRNPEDLAALPVIERAQIQRDPDHFLSKARPRSEYLALRSGGSSGAPCVVYHDVSSTLEVVAIGERHQAILRALVGKPRIRVLGIGSPRSSNAERRRFAAAHSLLPGSALETRAGRSVTDPPETLARDLEEIRPDVLMGYGSYLERLGSVLESGRYFVPRVLAYSGDMMSDVARKRISEVLGARVWSSYQAVECSRLAFECETQRGLHVHTDLCSVRIVDAAGCDVPAGVSGDVVISNFLNRGTVLLNYRLGDVAAFLPEPCSCGRGLPLLSFPMGRVDDWMAVPGGKQIHTQRLRTVFTDEETIWQYQVVQESLHAIRVAIVAAEHADRGAISARVAKGIVDIVGPDVALTIDFVADVQRTPAGKVRAILRSPAA